MTPEQASAHAALVLIRRLVRRRGLTVEEAVTAVSQRRRRETGPHTHLVVAEAHAVIAEAAAPICTLMEAMRPMTKAESEALAGLTRALQLIPRPTPAARRDRPAWATLYGPPPRRR